MIRTFFNRYKIRPIEPIVPSHASRYVTDVITATAEKNAEESSKEMVSHPSASKAKKAGKSTPYKKKKISRALREQVWIHNAGRRFEMKCPISWCQNLIDVFSFQCGHNVPESKGGKTTLDNLVPICGRCNLSMGNSYTLDEWSSLHVLSSKKPTIRKWYNLFGFK